jgi:hypothetical protein
LRVSLTKLRNDGASDSAKNEKEQEWVKIITTQH